MFPDPNPLAVRQNIALLDFQDVDRQRLKPMNADALLSTTKNDPATKTTADPLVGMFMEREDPRARPYENILLNPTVRVSLETVNCNA
jgi:hypothetical protein